MAGGGATAHAVTVLHIPRPRKIIRRRETIGRTPCRGQFTCSWQKAKIMPFALCLTSTRKPLCTHALHGIAPAT